MTKPKAKFNMIGIFVKDMRKMITFYRDILGFSIQWEVDSPYAEFEHEGIRISFYERSKLSNLINENFEDIKGINPTFELAINVGDKENVDKEYNRLIKQGVSSVYSPRDEPWYMRSAMVSDPDGNLVEIASDFWE